MTAVSIYIGTATILILYYTSQYYTTLSVHTKQYITILWIATKKLSDTTLNKMQKCSYCIAYYLLIEG